MDVWFASHCAPLAVSPGSITWTIVLGAGVCRSESNRCIIEPDSSHPLACLSTAQPRCSSALLCIALSHAGPLEIGAQAHQLYIWHIVEFMRNVIICHLLPSVYNVRPALPICLFIICMQINYSSTCLFSSPPFTLFVCVPVCMCVPVSNKLFVFN